MPVENADSVDTQGNDPDVMSFAALFNGEFSIDWIQEVSGLKASEILLDLHEGVRQSWLNQSAPDLFCFSDGEKQQVLLDAIPEEENRKRHGRIVDLISRQEPNGTETLQALAHHLLRADRNLAACRELVRTAYALDRAYHKNDALRCYSEAIRHLASERGPDADRLFVDAVVKYCRIFTGEDDPEWITATIEDAVHRAEETELRPLGAVLKMHQAKYEWHRGEEDLAIRHFEEAWKSAQAEGEPATLRRARYFRMFFYDWQERYRDVVKTYEEAVPEIERYPRQENPIIVKGTVGLSYVYCGHVSLGLGMLKGLYDHCSRLDDPERLSYPALYFSQALLATGYPDEAIGIIEGVLGRAKHRLGAFVEKSLHAVLAQAYGEKGDLKKAMGELRRAAGLVSGKGRFVPAIGSKRLVPIALAIDGKKLSAATGISMEATSQMTATRYVFSRGMSYYLQALLMQKQTRPPDKIAKVLLRAIKWVGESGNVIQLAKIRLELARTYLMMGNETRARKIARAAYGVLSPINEDLIPKALMPLIEVSPAQDDLRDVLLDLGREIVGIRDHRELVHHILSTINRITGSERGAIFLIESNPEEPKLVLSAARSLTFEDISHETFQPSMAFIRETASGKTGRIMDGSPHDKRSLVLDDRRRRPRSAFCIPMVLRNRTIGVLYHDNLLMRNTVSEPDLDVLSYFADWATIALENARAYEEIQHLNQQLKEEKAYYLEQHLKSSQFEDFVGESPAIKRTLAQIQQVAATDTTVLIRGETGVGKELVARAIHQTSNRSTRPFIRVDCSALSENLITSELFGHERGAFTGATQQHIGRFELANGGTLLLDEIGNIPMEVQNRLLRVLETREFQRVGSVKTIRSDFRLLAATNENLSDAVACDRFRQDLFYRLNVFPVTVPPLRERREDISLLALFFLKAHNARMGKSLKSIAKSDMDKLVKYPWPGNVRELENVIERGTILSTGSRFNMPELSPESGGTGLGRAGLSLAENEKQHILWALRETRGKIQGKDGAAALLDIHHNTLRSRMKKLGIHRSALDT